MLILSRLKKMPPNKNWKKGVAKDYAHVLQVAVFDVEKYNTYSLCNNLRSKGVIYVNKVLRCWIKGYLWSAFVLSLNSVGTIY